MAMMLARFGKLGGAAMSGAMQEQQQETNHKPPPPVDLGRPDVVWNSKSAPGPRPSGAKTRYTAPAARLSSTHSAEPQTPQQSAFADAIGGGAPREAGPKRAQPKGGETGTPVLSAAAAAAGPRGVSLPSEAMAWTKLSDAQRTTLGTVWRTRLSGAGLAAAHCRMATITTFASEGTVPKSEANLVPMEGAENSVDELEILGFALPHQLAALKKLRDGMKEATNTPVRMTVTSPPGMPTVNANHFSELGDMVRDVHARFTSASSHEVGDAAQFAAFARNEKLPTDIVSGSRHWLKKLTAGSGSWAWLAVVRYDETWLPGAADREPGRVVGLQVVGRVDASMEREVEHFRGELVQSTNGAIPVSIDVEMWPTPTTKADKDGDRDDDDDGSGSGSAKSKNKGVHSTSDAELEKLMPKVFSAMREEVCAETGEALAGGARHVDFQREVGACALCDAYAVGQDRVTLRIEPSLANAGLEGCRNLLKKLCWSEGNVVQPISVGLTAAAHHPEAECGATSAKGFDGALWIDATAVERVRTDAAYWKMAAKRETKGSGGAWLRLASYGGGYGMVAERPAQSRFLYMRGERAIFATHRCHELTTKAMGAHAAYQTAPGFVPIHTLLPQFQPAVQDVSQEWQRMMKAYVLGMSMMRSKGAAGGGGASEPVVSPGGLRAITPLSTSPLVYVVPNMVTPEECTRLARIGHWTSSPEAGAACSDRLGVCAWPEGAAQVDDTLANVRARVHAMLGVETPADGEETPAKTGLGAMQLAFWPPMEKGAEAPEGDNEVRRPPFNRVATVLIFLNDVKTGGKVAFPKMEGAEKLPDVEATRGSAVIAYAMLPDGKYDEGAALPAVNDPPAPHGLWTMHLGVELPQSGRDEAGRVAFAKNMHPLSEDCCE